MRANNNCVIDLAIPQRCLGTTGGGDQVNSTKQELLMAKRINGSCTTVAITDTPFSTSVPMDLSYIILQPTTILDL
jgi:hypothetical protein